MNIHRASNLLGQLSPAQFMRTVWHKRPLLIRQAVSPEELRHFTPRTVASLARSHDLESRLIQQLPDWSMEHGPFYRLPSRRQERWTVLVQSINLVDDEAAELMRRFRFIPDARLDDVMVSYATSGGGVGPHFDSYDVFLLQAHGQRRWRISHQEDLALQPNLPLKILRRFNAEEEWVLEPGDMLYLPPHVAHDGVAEGECVTLSIGFRAPSMNELTSEFLGRWADQLDLAGRYADPKQAATVTPARIPVDIADALEHALKKATWKRSDLDAFVGELLSEPKDVVVFDAPDVPLSAAAFKRQTRKQGVRLDRRTSMLYDARFIYINGERLEAPAWSKKLANERGLSPAICTGLQDDPDAPAAALLRDWYLAGWLHLA